jgi:hypothetical protein
VSPWTGYAIRAASSPCHRASIASRRAFRRSGSPRAASSIARMVPPDRSRAGFFCSLVSRRQDLPSVRHAHCTAAAGSFRTRLLAPPSGCATWRGRGWRPIFHQPEASCRLYRPLNGPHAASGTGRHFAMAGKDAGPAGIEPAELAGDQILLCREVSGFVFALHAAEPCAHGSSSRYVVGAPWPLCSRAQPGGNQGPERLSDLLASRLLRSVSWLTVNSSLSGYVAPIAALDRRDRLVAPW